MGKIVIFGGCGRIGTALGYFLDSLGHYVVAIDNNPKGRPEEYPYFKSIWWSSPDKIEEIDKFDIYVSCAPTSMNEDIRAAANKVGAKYVDFGGDTEHEDKVRDDFLNCEHGVMTGLGLAPGYANLILSDTIQYLIKNGKQPLYAAMYIGGVPQQKSENNLGWLPTWSIEGLIQSYEGSARVLENGNIKDVKSTEYGWADVVINLDNEIYVMETFANSGGISHTLYECLDAGIKNAFYYTLRWPGHMKTYRALQKFAKDVGLTDEQFKNYLLSICSTGGKDFVMGKTVVTYEDSDAPTGYAMTKCVIKFMPTETLTAMQIATALPGAAMIHHILDADLKGYLTYKDLDCKEVLNILATVNNRLNLGLSFGDTIEDAHDKSKEDNDAI